MLGVHGHPDAGRSATATTAGFASGSRRTNRARGCGEGLHLRVRLRRAPRSPTRPRRSAAGRADRVVVAAGYLVEPDQFALFDAGRALATDGAARPFSAGRERAAARRRGGRASCWSRCAARGTREVLAEVAGWGRAGDAHHVVPAATRTAPGWPGRSAPRCAGPGARRTRSATSTPTPPARTRRRRRGRRPAPGPRRGTRRSRSAPRSPCTGTALEGSGLLELVVTVARRCAGGRAAGRTPATSAPTRPAPRPDPRRAARRPASPYALSVNAAFGGANTALLVDDERRASGRTRRATPAHARAWQTAAWPTPPAIAGVRGLLVQPAGRRPSPSGACTAGTEARRPPRTRGAHRGRAGQRAAATRAATAHVAPRGRRRHPGRPAAVLPVRAQQRRRARRGPLGTARARWSASARPATRRADGLAARRLLIADGDADEVLVVLVEQAPTRRGVRAIALLVSEGESR